MVFMDLPNREVNIKLVYYGPALSGKTTNLQQLHRMMAGATSGDLVTLDTRNDRTLFFDLLPLSFETKGGIHIRLRLFTVPGQVFHNATRRIVLQGADGVAFVADSQVSETRANNESYANLKHNLRENGIAFDDVAVVIQFNKRDLPGIRSDEEVARIAAKGKEPVFLATAIEGKGVRETFEGLASATWRKLDARLELSDKLGVDHDAFMEQVRGLFRGPGGGG